MLRRLPLGLAGFLVACGGEDTTTALPSIEAIYVASASPSLTPYPSDAYAVADPTTATGLRLDLGAHRSLDPFLLGFPSTVEELNHSDGASTVGGAWAMFTAPIEVSTFATDKSLDPPVAPSFDANDFTSPEAPLLLLDVDPSSPEQGQFRALVPTYWEQLADGYYPSDELTLLAEPAEPLRPATRYLYAIRKGLHGKDGAEVGPSSDMKKLLLEAPTDAYGAELHEALAVLAEQGVGADELVLATVFTTQSVTGDMQAVAAAHRAAPAPALVSDIEVETAPTATDPRVRFKGAFEAPELRGDDGKWAVQGGMPKEQKKVGLEFFLAFSDSAQSGPRPVVIYAHGLGGTKDGCWGTTERLADIASRYGVAVIAIDSPEHGSRSKDPDDPLGATFSFFGIDAETQDFDIERARDNFRQMGSDQLELVRFVSSLGTLDLLPLGAPDGVPDLDVSRLAYIGHSFGSVQGPTVFALAPEIKQAVWNVGGAGLMRLLRDSGTFSLLVNAMKPPGTPDGALGRFFAVTQGIVDPGDPLNYARFGAIEAFPGAPAWQPRDMLLQEVIEDSIVPNSTSESLARAAGLVHQNPLRKVSGLATEDGPLTGGGPGGATAAFVQFDKVNGDQIATHGELIFTEEARAQYVTFFASGLGAEHATVAPAYP